MNRTTNNTYLLVGHVTKDMQADNSFTIGGTVTYASVVVKQLGWRPVIVTAAAPEFTPPPYLADVDWHILASPTTTTFRNEYDAQGKRRQTIGPVAHPINPADLPQAAQETTLVHLCPLAQELPPAIIDMFDPVPTFATPQGWMRHWDRQGFVSSGAWPGAVDILPKLRAAVISIEDIAGDWAIVEAWAKHISILIVTEGEKGCTVMHQGERQRVPPRPARPVDPTGAGDVFAAAFFIRYYETEDMWHSARFANVTASMALERPGPEGAARRDEIEDYLARN